MVGPEKPNRLYYGDCLTILREMPKYGVDLIYLDPPFNSNREYNAIYTDETGRPLPDQVEAFNDTWTLDEARERAIRHMPILLREAGVDDVVADFWKVWTSALRATNKPMLAYLSYMVERLAHMKSVLKPTGSVYLHCDPTASHYIKVMMDGIFGHSAFQNEIVWKRTSGHSDARKLGSVHDVILHYAPSSKATRNRQYVPYSADYIKRRYRNRDNDGRRWMSDNLTAKGLTGGGYEYDYKGARSIWRVNEGRMRELDAENRLHFTSKGGIRIKRYLDEMKGVPLNDVWIDIPPVNSQAKERLGYRTQKPVALLERILKASSNPGDVVLDPFCGCGTTMEAAQRLDRRWIGIDIAIHAVKRVARVRLQDRLQLVEGRDFVIEGVPRNVEGARDLWKRDPYHFQKWAVEAVDGFVTTKRTADGGIDGRLYFDVPGERDFQSMAIEVKGGKHVGIGVLRELRGVLEDDRARMAGLIVMNEPTPRALANWRSFMASAGDLEVHGKPYPKMQVRTVAEILDGKLFDTPSAVGRGSSQGSLGV